jgi:UDP-N-acetylmuramate--alanine ligase
MIPYTHIHFIGIGGIGMSALARMCLAHGLTVSGSDSSDSRILHDLEKEGVTIYRDHKKENLLESVDCVVYTLAIDNLNDELSEARIRELPLFTYAQMLGEVSKNMYTIAVAGTHGKTTTTAMVADVFLKNNRQPHVIVGSLLAQTGSNYIFGKEELFIVEACEYKRSFLNLNPNILLITNLEEDHLDYYKDLADIQDAFRTLVHKIPIEGYVICDTEDPKIKPILEEGCVARIIDYKKYVSEVPELYVLGDHNKINAALVLALADMLEFEKEKTTQALADFRGTWRRLEYRQELGSLKIYDDYAHHPTEIRAGITALKKRFPDMPLTVIFQPHLYSRTKEHFDNFVDVLSMADSVVLLPIYAAREAHDDSINSHMLGEKIKEKGTQIEFCEDIACATRYMLDHKDEIGIVVTMGAGDVYKAINFN